MHFMFHVERLVLGSREPADGEPAADEMSLKYPQEWSFCGGNRSSFWSSDGTKMVRKIKFIKA